MKYTEPINQRLMNNIHWALSSLLFLGSLSCGFSRLTILAEGVSRKTGPYEVYHNLICGLQQLGIPFNINPPDGQVGDVVHVVSGVHNLEKAIQWKRSGKIQRLIGGPNVMNRPNEFNYLFAQKEVDACFVPSYWIQVAYEEDAPALKGRIHCWFTGVDCEYWKPIKQEKNGVLVYWKTEDEGLVEAVEMLIRKYGLVPIRIRYGGYQKDTFKTVLNRCQYAVFISRSESQGMALAEAWAMDVPTFSFDPGSLIYRGKRYSLVSSCPYLTPDTGKPWKTLNELEKLLTSFDVSKYHPRKWVLEYMTIAASIRQLVEIIKHIEE